MRVLVTGATGFVGSHIARELQQQGHTVRALVRTPAKLETVTARAGVDVEALEVAQGDITDAEAVTAAVDGCDAVVHAAAVVGIDPTSEAAIEVSNFAGALNVLGAAVDGGCDPIVSISTAAALFPFRSDVVTGDDPVGTAKAPYARTKAQAEVLARRYQAAGHPVVTIYPGMVMGPDDWGGSTQLDPLRLWIVKPFPRSRDYTLTIIDVRDIAAVTAASMTPGRGPKRYIMFGRHVTSDELHGLLCEATGRDLKAVNVPGIVFRAWGRLGDAARRFGRDLVLTSEAVEYMFNTKPGDNSFTESDSGVSLRPVSETLADTIAWLHEAGHLSAEEAGVAAR